MRWPSAGQPGAGANVRGIDFTEFVGADGRRSIRRLGVVGDDRRSFGTKSLSSLVPQLWV